MSDESVNMALWRAMRNVCGHVVLDVDCGTGVLGARLTANGNIVDGITHSPGDAVVANERIAHVSVMDLNDVVALATLAGGYDALIFADVLNRLIHPGSTLTALLPRLKPNGKIYISLPNIACFYNRLGLLFGRFPMPKTSGEQNTSPLHYFTRTTARTFLESAGLAIECEDFVPAPTAWAYRHVIKPNVPQLPTNALVTRTSATGQAIQLYEKVVYPVEHFFASFWRSLFADHFVFICVRKS
ncbi:MAG: methyltransferase domain-containing protein [Planctomycetota bacterium]